MRKKKTRKKQKWKKKREFCFETERIMKEKEYKNTQKTHLFVMCKIIFIIQK